MNEEIIEQLINLLQVGDIIYVHWVYSVRKCEIIDIDNKYIKFKQKFADQHLEWIIPKNKLRLNKDKMFYLCEDIENIKK